MTARWTPLPSERRELYSPIGLKPIDLVTQSAPLGWIRASLDMSDGAGGWLATRTKAKVSMSGILSYPGLERRAAPEGQPARKYRVRIEAEYYVPLYRRKDEGIEFDAWPYNDLNPPQNYNDITQHQPQPLELTPLPHYPFPGHVPVLRGIVRDAAGPVANVVVRRGNDERVLTDARGVYALPLRSLQANTQHSIDADDERAARSETITIQFPQDLRKSQTITFP